MKLPLSLFYLAIAVNIPWLSPVPINAQPKPLQPLFAAPPLPPNTGAPGSRKEAGSRGCPQEDQPLTALVPGYPAPDGEIVWSVTLTGTPDFWFYVPYTADSAYAELVLEDSAQQQTILPVTLATQPGVMRVRFPEAAKPLAPDQSYHWYFNVYCKSDGRVASFVEGEVTRKSSGTAFDRQFIQGNIRQRLALFARNGIWHDALTVAGALRCARSDDSAWTQLLQDVDLSHLVQTPIVNCEQ